MRWFVALVSLILLPSVALCSSSSKNSVAVESFIQEAAGIRFYAEKRGSGPVLVLVTSGQGDSGAYKYLADILAADFTVITFDPPGFSRSGPPPTWDGLSSKSLGDETAAFVRSLGIEQAYFYGSSSGGVMVMSLIADHPELVKSAVVHEPAVIDEFPFPGFFLPKKIQWDARNHDSIEAHERATIREATALISDPSALEGLGEGHIERRIKNKQIWYDRYLTPDVPCCNREYQVEELRRAPLKVTLGEDSAWFMKYAVKSLVSRADLDLIWHPGKHFPYITAPEVVAETLKDSFLNPDG